VAFVVGAQSHGTQRLVTATIVANLLNHETAIPDLIVEFCSANLAVLLYYYVHLPVGTRSRSHSHVWLI
jgi:hypothetical protein